MGVNKINVVIECVSRFIGGERKIFENFDQKVRKVKKFFVYIYSFLVFDESKIFFREVKLFVYYGNRRLDFFCNISYDLLEFFLIKKIFKGGQEGIREIFFLMFFKYKMKMKRNKVIGFLQLSD